MFEISSPSIPRAGRRYPGEQLRREEWMSSAQFTLAVEELDRFTVHQGEIIHDDEDAVTKREFERNFCEDTEVARSISRGTIRGEWVKAVLNGGGASPLEVIENVLVSAWGG